MPKSGAFAFVEAVDFPIGQRSSWRQTIDTFRNDIQLKGRSGLRPVRAVPW
jgi:hypothetical protein